MPERVNGKVPEDLGTKPETSLSSFWRILLRRSTVFVLILVFLGNSVTESEWLKEQLPFIAVFEMTIHRCMSRLDPPPKPARYVTIVAVDDDAHYSPPLSGAKPTRRSYLATLLVEAISSDPMVVAIDFRLLKQSPTAKDSELLKAIRTANARRIAVVLVDWVPDTYQEAANIFADSDVIPLTTFGLANLPTDARKIPLQSTILRSDGKELVKRKSFPLAVVEAYDNDTEALVPTAAEHMIAAALRDNEFVYGGGMLREDLERATIAAKALYNAKPEALRMCHHRIVIIGDTWHKVNGSRRDSDFDDVSYSSLAGCLKTPETNWYIVRLRQ